MRPTALLTVFAFVLAGLSARADESYRFNSDGTVKPEGAGSYQFKVPADGGKKPEQYVQEAEVSAENLYKAPLGYPKKELFASINPGNNGFKNTLSSTREFNYGGSATNVSVGWKYVPSLEEDFTLQADYSKVSVPDFADPAAALSVKGSDVAIYTVTAAANFCKVRDNAFHRLCPGVRLSLDTFPTLQFPTNSNTSVQLKNVQDMTIGADLRYERPLFGSVAMSVLGAWDHGFGLGSSGELATKNNDKVTGLLAFEFPAWKLKWSVGAGLEYRKAKVESALDSWEVQDVTYTGRIGAIYEWGAL